MDTTVNITRPEGSEPSDFHLSRRAFGVSGLFFAGYALSAGAATAEAITTDSDGLFAKNITIAPLNEEGAYHIPAYVAMPAKAGKHPVIIVVSEIFGLHDYIRDICRRFAKQGYVALALDFFARKGNAAALPNIDQVRPLVEAATYPQVMNDISAALKWLANPGDIGQPHGLFGGKGFADMARVGITGYCWGGTPVWMAAATLPGIKAGVAWYGRLERPARDQFLGAEDRPWPIDIAATLEKPVLGLYADHDQGIPVASVQRMNDALAAARKTPSHIIVLDNTQHAFFADYRPSYNPDASKIAWADCLDWFKKYL